MESSLVAVGPPATTSGGKSVQFVSVRLVTYCTRYVSPSMALQEIVRTSLDSETFWTGGGATKTVNDFASSNGGIPLSVTRTVKLLVVFANVPSGVHPKTPFVALMPAPVGAPGSRLNVKVCATSGSVAE